MDQPLLSLEDVSMTYPAAGRPGRQVLSSVSLAVDRGTSAALVGRSGSGKSTLLHLASGIASPTGGRILLDGVDLAACSERERTRQRQDKVGLVFQFFHLLPHLSVLENVALPGWIAGDGAAAGKGRARELLERVGLAERAEDAVARLSGGEMQRVAICRALLRRPALVLADEPTGSLDDATGDRVLTLLLELVRDEGGSLLYVTHSRELAARADRIWELHDGVLTPGSAA